MVGLLQLFFFLDWSRNIYFAMFLAEVDSYWARQHNGDSPSFTIVSEEENINLVVGAGLGLFATAGGPFVLS
jgi:hypothetical protein